MKRGRILLINPKMCRPSGVRLPLSLLSIGAVLEGRFDYRIVDGNVDPDAVGSALAALGQAPHALVGVSVMPGPQVAPAIEISAAIRAAHPRIPIAWGGYFPTLYPSAALNAPYVDYVVREQGEMALLDLLNCLPAPDESAVRGIGGISWKLDGAAIHNPARGFSAPADLPLLPYERLGGVDRYLRPSFMGTRTAVHQCAIGCRYHCTFCGVVSMFNGYTRSQGAERLEASLRTLRDGFGANSLQFYDHNFFDSEAASIPILEVLARFQLPWWCYARADTLAQFSRTTWDLLRKSRFTMAYIGAEAASDQALKRMRKGARVEHTFEAARLCREHGVIPEFSFVLGGPEDPEGEIESTLTFVKRLKKTNPQCEVVLYFYSPTPQRDSSWRRADPGRSAIPILQTYGPEGPELPTTPEEWTEPRWLDYVCHQDAPWLSPRMRRRVKDFSKVLSCRFPTVQDYATPAWGKRLLRTAAAWRYSSGRYANPLELDVLRRFIPLREPQRDSL